MNAGATGSSETVYFEPARFFGRFGNVQGVCTWCRAQEHFHRFSLGAAARATPAARRGARLPVPHESTPCSNLL